MFNSDDDLIMKRLDKGHLSYLNYVRMEHWYNNSVLNGFCEMLLESMFYSQIYEAKFKAMVRINLRKKQIRIYNRSFSEEPRRNFNVIHEIVGAPAAPKRSVSFSPDTIDFNLNITQPSVEKINEEEETELNEDDKDNNTNDNQDIDRQISDDFEMNFNIRSFLRLRNLMYLCVLLNKNPSLKMYRYEALKSRRTQLKDESQKK